MGLYKELMMVAKTQERSSDGEEGRDGEDDE